MTTFTESLQRVAADPGKGARLMARSFYRELRRAGFADRDIMTIADELLGCLMASLREYRVKKEIAVAQAADPARGGGGNPSPDAGAAKHLT